MKLLAAARGDCVYSGESLSVRRPPLQALLDQTEGLTPACNSCKHSCLDRVSLEGVALLHY